MGKQFVDHIRNLLLNGEEPEVRLTASTGHETRLVKIQQYVQGFFVGVFLDNGKTHNTFRIHEDFLRSNGMDAILVN